MAGRPSDGGDPEDELAPGLTVLLPCFNEAERVEAAWAAIDAALGSVPGMELLIVDDGSTDETLAKIRRIAAADARVRYLSFSRNFGLEAAQEAGFRHASREWLVQLDADLQSPPAEAHKLLDAARDGRYDVVFGIRENRRDPWVRRLGSRSLGGIARRLLGIDLPAGASVFRVIHTPVARRLAALELGAPYTVASIVMIGARYTCVPTSHRRREGRSRWRPGRLVGHTFELFFGYSWRPLNAAYLVAALLALISLVVAAMPASRPGGTALAERIDLVTAAATLVILAVVGRYLYRSMRDQRRYPAYLVREANFEVPRRYRLDAVAVSGERQAR
jgi:polyisoprenyl-phosphate glycosyltransferase